MADLIAGKITGHGPVKTAQYPQGDDVAYLAYPGEPVPPDLPPDLPYLEILPFACTVDMETLKKNWVQVFSPKIQGKTVWCELPRFSPDIEDEPPDEDVSTFTVNWKDHTITLAPK